MKQLIIALGALALSSCARPVVPEGGPKDTTPPAVVPEKSTPNMATRFEGREIKLTFDEWVTLQDVGAQVLISPPMAKRPDVTLKKKTVTVRFDKDEVLRPNTTYTINFGTAVKDLHESNPAKDLRFVFSTGDFIDSLSVAGQVVDAFSGEPVENIAVMLYDNPDDSIVRKERPYYVTRTDKTGQFTIPNVRAGAFKYIAIDDTNQNMKWDGDTERIGFPEQAVVVNDSTHRVPDIRIYQPAPPFRLITRNAKSYGLIRLGFSGPPDTVTLAKPELPGLKWLVESDKDTLLVWYDLPEAQAWDLTWGTDTVPVKALSREDFLAATSFGFADERPSAPSTERRTSRPSPAATPPAGPRPVRTVTANPNKPVLLTFNHPIAAIDTSKWLLVSDTMALRDFDATPDSANTRSLRLRHEWLDGKKYQLQLLPGAVTDFFGASNTDTLQRNVTVPAEKQLGTLNLSLLGLKPGATYILNLLNGNALEEARFFTADTASVRFVFSRLQPVAYTAQLIEDGNGNRRWDPGDYFGHRQPERVFLRKLDALRANWEVEAVLDTAPSPVSIQRLKNE